VRLSVLARALHVRTIVTKFVVLVHVTHGRGSVLLWRRSDTLCTSGFMYDELSLLVAN